MYLTKSSRYLLDTGVVGELLNNDPIIRRRLKGATFFVSIVVAGELYHGAFNSTTRARNLKNVRDFLAIHRFIPLDEQSAERFGIISTGLQKRGRVIPHNDIWIAAQALQFDLTVVTHDAHFKEIPDVMIEHW